MVQVMFAILFVACYFLYLKKGHCLTVTNANKIKIMAGATAESGRPC